MPIPKAIMAPEHPVGSTTANHADTQQISTMDFTFMPPAKAVEAAMGLMRAMVPMLDMKLVIMVTVTQNTMDTNSPLGLPPRMFNTVWPINSPAPVVERAVETTLIPATIHTMSLVKDFITSGMVNTLNTIRTRRPAAGMTLVISLPNWLVNMKPAIMAINTPKMNISSFLEMGSASLTSFTCPLSMDPLGIRR